MERSELRPMLRQNFPRQRDSLLPALHYLQGELGHLPEWAPQIVGWHLRIPASEVYGVATSYSELRLDAPQAHTLRVCDGLGCWYNGGEKLLEELVDILGVQPGETTAEGEVSLSLTPCGYLCALAPVGVVMGGGGVTAVEAGTPIVDVARRLATYNAAESCGKCTPCREGTPRMVQALERLASGRGSPEDLEELGYLADVVGAASLCGLGQMSGGPIRSALYFFGDELASLAGAT